MSTTTKETKLALSYRSAILERHLAGVEADKVLRQAILSKLEQTRLTGQMIASAAGDLPNGQFEQAVDFLSKDAVQAYMRFARQNPEPVDDLQTALHAIRLALQVSGTLEFPDGHGQQVRHKLNFFSTCESMIQSIAAQWAKFIRLQPIKQWRIEALEGFAMSLKPIASMLEVVHVELKHRRQ